MTKNKVSYNFTLIGLNRWRNSITKLFIILFLSATTYTVQAQDKVLDQAQYSLDQALIHQKNKNFPKAILSINKAIVIAKEEKSSELIFNTNYRLLSILIDTKEFAKAKLILDEMETNGIENEDQKFGVNSLKSKFFKKMGFLEEALKYKLNCLNLQHNYQVVIDIASLYLSIGKADSAIYYFSIQLEIADSLNKTKYKISGNNNLGFSFYILNELDSANYYFQRAVDLYDRHKEEEELSYPLYATINGNIGQIKFLKGEYKEAIEYFFIDFESNYNSQQYNSCITIGKSLCDSYIETGETKSISEILSKLSAIKSKISRQKFLILSNLEIKYYKYLKNSIPLDEIIQINTDSLNSYVNYLKHEIKEAAVINAEFQAKQNSLKLSLEMSELKAKNEIIIQEEKYSRIKIILLSSISFLIIVLGIIWYQFKRKQHQNEELILKNEKMELNYELINKKSDLTDLAIHITRNQDFNTKVLDLLTLLKNANKEDYKIKIRNLSNFIKQQLNNVETIELFQKNIEIINVEFFQKLELKHPGLTKNEKEISGLLRLNLSNKEIANIKNISVQSSRTARYRLKKKLNIGDETELSIYFKQF